MVEHEFAQVWHYLYNGLYPFATYLYRKIIFKLFKAKCMKIYSLYVVLVTFLSVTAIAQTKTVSQTATSTSQAKAPVQKSLSDQADSLKMAVNDIKTSFHSLFGNKRDTISIITQYRI